MGTLRGVSTSKVYGDVMIKQYHIFLQKIQTEKEEEKMAMAVQEEDSPVFLKIKCLNVLKLNEQHSLFF